MIDKLKESIANKDRDKLSPNEVKVGYALIDLMTNWEDVFAVLGSNKFNKSSILMYLKETTLLSTKEIRNSMRKYKMLYFDTKKSLL